MENFTNEEKNYYELLVDTLDDGKIDDSERNILNKQKEKYGISEARAKELEDFAKNEILENKNSKVSKYENNNISKKEDSIKEYEDNEAEKEDYEILKYKKRKNKNRDISFFDRITYYAKNKRHPLLKIYTYVIVLALEVYLARNCVEYINNAKADSWLGSIFNYFANGVKNFFDKISNGAVTGGEWVIRLILTIVILLAFFIIFNLLLIYLPAFISLMGNRSKKQIKRDINLSTIFVSLVLIIFSYFFVRDNNKELNLMRKNVNTYIKNGNYQKAYEEINNTKGKQSINEDVRTEEYQKLLDAITNKLNSMNTNNASIMSVYKNVINEKEVKNYADSYNQAIASINERNFNNYIITDFITPKKYSDAYNIIDKTNYSKEIKNTAFNSLVSAIYSDFGSRVNLEMNKENYDFINNQIIFVYDKISKNIKDIENRYNIDSYKNTLDKNRDDYLKKLMGEISNTSNPDEARKKLNNVYHNSTEDKDGAGKKFFVFNKSYKDYWEDVKKEYSKKLNKK